MSSSANLYREAAANVDAAADDLGLEPAVRDILSSPQHELIVNFPVQRDSGEYVMFQGYRIQHNNVLGPSRAVCDSTRQSILTRCGRSLPG